MTRKRLLWQLYPSYLLITLFALLAVTWYTSRALHVFYHEQVVEELESRVRMVGQQISQALNENEWSDLDKTCKRFGRAGNARITVILPTGRVVGDSEKDPLTMDNHADRPEIIQAIKSGRGQYLRFSETLQKNMMYFALPVRKQDSIVGIIRASIPVTAINQALKSIYLKIGLGGLVIAFCAAGVCLIVSRRISRPIEQMRQGAQHFAQGKFDVRVPVPDSVELAALAESINEMARQLHERIQTVTEQRNELEAVLSSMVEGVLAVDLEGRIMNINQAAAHLLGVDPERVKEQAIQEVVRNPSLQAFVEKTVKSDNIIEADIVLTNGEERFFRVHGTGLSDSSGRKTGAVIVLNDMTQLHRLENIRRDFVANVSHELKTPITSIKGFVETLQEGALEDHEKARQFLEVLAQQTDRLNAIIEDLLSLSCIEQDSEKGRISFEQEGLKSVIEAAIELSQIQADRKNVSLELSCDDNIIIRINTATLEQAVVNLIDNAVKYSPQGGKIQIHVLRKGDEIVISVQDNGCGIPPEHIDRIFERFYVVDKARSRKLGGTGLGLAIVKHIAQAHGGNVSVESTPGKGSAFTIHLPAV